MKILKNKKGVAIETALLFMIVIFFLCMTVMFIALQGYNDTQREREALERRVEIDQIGEDFLAGKTDFSDENYNCQVDGNKLTVKYKDSENVVLYVEMNGDKELIRWQYSQP